MSIINDDDETNKDDDVEDEFASSADLSRVHVHASGAPGVGAGGGVPPRGLSWQSSTTSAEEEETDSADAKETVYYMPCNVSESDVASDR